MNSLFARQNPLYQSFVAFQANHCTLIFQPGAKCSLILNEINKRASHKCVSGFFLHQKTPVSQTDSNICAKYTEVNISLLALVQCFV